MSRVGLIPCRTKAPVSLLFNISLACSSYPVITCLVCVGDGGHVIVRVILSFSSAPQRKNNYERKTQRYSLECQESPFLVCLCGSIMALAACKMH
uniref:Uncharacterized protein n=1 Tax=Leishmania guyanensis TaxID=5670 RepID=A0A1E1IUH6_LEIGU|nr:Hypothetical protein BN36_2024320 [Leishmania guyanensis]